MINLKNYLKTFLLVLWYGMKGLWRGSSSARVELWKSTTAPVPLVLPEFLWSSYNGSPRSQFHPAGLRAAPPPGWVLLWKSLYYCTNCSRHHPDNMPAARLKLIWLHWSLICWWKFQFWSIALETILSQVFDMDKLLSSPTWQHAGCSVDTSLMIVDLLVKLSDLKHIWY